MLKLGDCIKQYSSWSLRGWLVLKHAAVPFEEIVVPLDMPDTAASIRKYSPSGRVPALIDGDVTVCDSLGIDQSVDVELQDELLWPKDSVERARARAVGAGVHSGFPDPGNGSAV